jgi:hypothetical protein
LEFYGILRLFVVYCGLFAVDFWARIFLSCYRVDIKNLIFAYGDRADNFLDPLHNAPEIGREIKSVVFLKPNYFVEAHGVYPSYIVGLRLPASDQPMNAPPFLKPLLNTTYDDSAAPLRVKRVISK